MARVIKHSLLALVSTCVLGLVMGLSTSQAEFTLNFQPHSGDGDLGDGGRGGWGGGGSRGSRGQDWEFADEDILQEMVNDNGQEYYHVIIKDDYQDFALDFYIKTASPDGFYDSSGGRGGSWGGGDNTGPASSSAGDGGPDLEDFEDPFQTEAGNGSGNPSRVYMRMILRDGGIDQEFLKASLTQKPIITQTVEDFDFRDEVVIDMTNSDYTQMDLPGTIDIHTVVSDSGFDGGVSEFEFSRDAQRANVTAGQFTYSPEDKAAGASSTTPGGSGGTYSYAEGGFDVYEVDWLEFCDPDQNPRHDCRFDGSSRGDRGGRGGGW